MTPQVHIMEAMRDQGGSDSEQGIETEPKMDKISKWKNLISFWIFGLTNNFAYVVMLSAAHDILHEEEKETGGSNSTNVNTTTTPSSVNNSTNSGYLQCNPISTGAVLLADVLPTLIVKLTFPFFMQRIPYWIKISLVSAAGITSFLIVALAHEIWLSILGVIFASFGAGLGEITFLSLTTFYPVNVVSMWSSGTGGAGVLGALAYAALTTAGLSARLTLLIMICIPVLMIVTYIFVLTEPPTVTDKKDDDSLLLMDDTKQKQVHLTLKQMFQLIPSLLKYMLPLSLVYFAEYYINQGLHEILYFQDVWLSKSEQYRWYQVDYQIGVLISRSSVNCIHIKKLWLLPILQFGNMALLLCQVFLRFIPSIWIILIIIFWEGLLGGAAYVNTFYRMSNELPKDQKEYSIGLATVGDSLGISLAGIAAIPSHNAICKTRIKL